MAVINTIASKSAGCGGEEINTGDLGCDIAFGLVTHALGLSKGVVIAKETELSLSVIEALVQKGDIIPLMDAFSSEPTMSEDTLETSPLGVEALTLKGLPKYSLTMKKGQNYYKQMAKLTGFGNINYVLGDVNGNWKFAVTSSGDTTLSIKAVLESDRITEIEGLVLANFTTSAGTISAAVDNGNGFYSLTVGSLTPGLLTVATKDAAVGVNVIKVSSALYRSNLLSATVAS